MAKIQTFESQKGGHNLKLWAETVLKQQFTGRGMFGWINDCTEKLVVSKFGLEKWHEIKEKAGCTVDDEGFVRHEYYPDESTVSLVVAASDVLGLTVDQVLEAFGQFFMEFTRDQGFENLLQCQGNTLRSWLANMNALHDHLESSLPRGMVKPVFWCEDDDVEDGVMILHYYSKRGNLLVQLVVGVVKEVARYHFDVQIDMQMLRKQAEDGASHTSWRIKASNPEEKWKITVKESSIANLSDPIQGDTMRPMTCPFTGLNFPTPQIEPQEEQAPARKNSNGCHSNKIQKEPSISSRQMKKLFPYHVVIDQDFDIIQVGASLPSIMRTTEQSLIGRNIVDTLAITKPVLGAWDWMGLKKLEDQTFFIDPVDKELGHVKFKANMVKISEPSESLQVMIVLSPDVKNVKELRDMKLTMSDLPLHSFQRDSVFLGEHIVSEVQASLKLEKLSKKLKHEQILSNALLYELLPSHVADELRTGKTVQPELHEDVTLFFSDIVGFTTICENIFPWDCVDLLNRLYCVMDFLAKKFELYKIETIGDSYLCSSGLLYDDPNHARNVANFAIAVMHCSKLVMNPVNGHPIELRVGIHSGPCMTGVVGMTCPRYCVFGDTVNTASRHESTGVPGLIQCSSTTFGKLEHFSPTKEFVFIPRGLIDMKGKGLMATYFLDGGSDLNDAVSPEALKTLASDVQAILEKQKFSNKKYFKRYGRRASEVCFRTTESIASTSETVASEDSFVD